MLAEPILNI